MPNEDIESSSHGYGQTKVIHVLHPDWSHSNLRTNWGLSYAHFRVKGAFWGIFGQITKIMPRDTLEVAVKSSTVSSTSTEVNSSRHLRV